MNEASAEALRYVLSVKEEEFKRLERNIKQDEECLYRDKDARDELAKTIGNIKTDLSIHDTAEYVKRRYGGKVNSY